MIGATGPKAWHLSAAGEDGYAELVRVPDLSVGVYRLPVGGLDPQGPHTEDEVYTVLRGRAVLELGDLELDVIRDLGRDRGDRDLGAEHVEHAALGLADELDRDVGLDLDAAHHGLELDMDDAVAQVVPLQLAHHGGLDLATDLDVEEVLMLAAGYNGNPQVLDKVLDMGVDVHARDHEGRRAMDFARLNRSIHSSPAYIRLQQLSSLQ